MDSDDHQTSAADPLLACCLCKRLIRDAVQLACLHNCCRQCFSMAVSKSSSQGVVCVKCNAVTKAGFELPNRFIDSQVQCYMLIAEPGVCGICAEKGERDNLALAWCSACKHSFCEGCVAQHREINRQHVMLSLEELKSVDELRLQFASSACPIHNEPLDVACLNCEQAKCSICWAKCKENRHAMHIVGDESFDSYMSKLIACISTMESELLLKTKVLEKPMSILRDTNIARDRHLEELDQRKRRIVDAVEFVYQEMKLYTKNAYDDLQAEVVVAAAAADHIESDLIHARSYIRQLVDSNDKCEIFRQQKNVRERLSFLSAELDGLRDRLATTIQEVKIEMSLPEDLEEIVRTWIGVPQGYLAALSSPHPGQQLQQQRISFSTASASVQLPVHCEDVSLANDRRLLLAADKHGLIEISCLSGRQLSCWRPVKHNNLEDDAVQAVAALGDGRAAVSLRFARCVVLLRRKEKSRISSEAVRSSGLGLLASGDEAWTEDRRLDPLPWPPRWLSAHGDVLAVSEWYHGRRLQLLSLSRGRRLSAELLREYDIGSLAVTARAVISGSRCLVQLGSDRGSAQVLDAHSLAEGRDKRLWRYVLSSSDAEEMEELRGVCADSSGGCLYAAVWSSEQRRGRVSALSLADGRELRRVVLSFETGAAPQWPHLLLLPTRLSLYDCRAVSEQQKQSSSGRELLLVTLCWDSTSKDCTKVTVHLSGC